MKTILQIQQEIIHEFPQSNAAIEQTLYYLIQQGKSLPPMPARYKTDEHILKGCHSTVWLAAVPDNGLVYFQTDSNTAITKGLIRLLMRILNGQPPEAIVAADLWFMQEKCLARFIGNERSNGLAAMICYMKAYADKFLINRPEPGKA